MWEKKSLDTNNLTFLVCITFLELQGSGKKKNAFVGLTVWMWKEKKMLNKNKFVYPPKNENVPQNFC